MWKNARPLNGVHYTVFVSMHLGEDFMGDVDRGDGSTRKPRRSVTPDGDVLLERKRIAKLIRDIMYVQHLSRDDAAELFGVYPQTISRYRSGVSVPDADRLLVFLRRTGVSTEVFENPDYLEGSGIVKPSGGSPCND